MSNFYVNIYESLDTNFEFYSDAENEEEAEKEAREAYHKAWSTGMLDINPVVSETEVSDLR
jgi:hypothetical protein